MCERWNDFALFVEDMGAKPLKGWSIERIDNDGDYEPNNCKWVSIQEQQKNKSNTHYVTAKGETKHIAEWTRGLGASAATVYSRIYRGWPPALAVTLPLGSKKPDLEGNRD